MLDVTFDLAAYSIPIHDVTSKLCLFVYIFFAIPDHLFWFVCIWQQFHLH